MSGLGPVDGQSRPQDIHIGSPSTKAAEHLEQMKHVAPGNMAGENLVIADYNEDGIADADIIGSKPTLSPPTIDGTMASYQSAIGQLEGVEAKSTKDQMLGVLLQRLGSDAELALARQTLPPISQLKETDSTLSASLGSEYTFNADFSKKDMTVMLDGGNRVDYHMNEGKLSATLNGEPVKFASEELGALADFFVLMELFHEMGVSQRQMSREARNATNAGVVKNIQNQAEEQRQAAVSQLVAGVISGSVKMASAALSMAGSAKGMKADAAAAKAGHPPQSFQGQMISQKYSALGSALEAGGEIGAAGARYDAAQHDAEQTMLRAGEEQLKHVKQTEQDQMQVAQELLSKARETFAQVWAQIIQTQQNLARNI